MGVLAALEALVDVVLEGGCAGCGAAAPTRSALCRSCHAQLNHAARPAWPTPAPAGLPAPFAVAAYDGAVREAVLAYKEHARLSLARPLGAAVAGAARPALAQAREAARSRTDLVLLVPVPSRRAAVRARGYDATAALARHAAATLRREGLQVRAAPALRQARRVSDQAGLDAEQRVANLAGAIAVRRRWAARVNGKTAVVVDDVITTGASLSESARALRGSGCEVLGAAVVAATARRVMPPPGGEHVGR